MKKSTKIYIGAVAAIVVIGATATGYALLKQKEVRNTLVSEGQMVSNIEKDKIKESIPESKIQEEIKNEAVKYIKKLSGIDIPKEELKVVKKESYNSKPEYKVTYQEYKIMVSFKEDKTFLSYSDFRNDNGKARKLTDDEKRKMANDALAKLGLQDKYEIATIDEGVSENDVLVMFKLKTDKILDAYNSVKLFFNSNSPILSVMIFETPKAPRENQMPKITKEQVISIVQKQFKDIDKILEETLEETTILPNNFYTRKENEEFKKENIVVEAWKVDVIRKDKNSKFKHKYIVYIDKYSGEIVAGDMYKHIEK